MLRDAYSKMTPPFTLEDAENLINEVHCSFVDSAKACAQAGERTLVQYHGRSLETGDSLQVRICGMWRQFPEPITWKIR